MGAYFACCRSVEVDRPFIDDMHRWFPYGISDGLVQDLAEEFLPWRKRDSTSVLGANRLYTGPTVVWAVHTTDLCSLESAVSYMRPRSQVDLEVVAPSTVYSSFSDVYDFALDAETE